MVSVHGRQSIGQRKSQQDAIDVIFDNPKDPGTNTLMLLSDGMGGHVGGEIASDIAVKTFAKHFVQVSQATRPSVRLREALETANNAIAARIKRQPDLSGMGCTMVGCLKLNDRFHWVSVGDSIVYLFRDGHLRRLNADHSVYGELMELVQQGKLDQADADQNPKRHALRSALIGGKILLIDQNVIDLKRHDLLILASDGLDTLTKTEISGLLNSEKMTDVRTLSALLLTKVEEKHKPRQDNTSVIVYRHVSGGTSTLADGASVWSSTGSGSKDFLWSKSTILGLAGAAVALVMLVYLIVGGSGSNIEVEVSPKPADFSTGTFSGSIDGSVVSPETDEDDQDSAVDGSQAQGEESTEDDESAVQEQDLEEDKTAGNPNQVAPVPDDPESGADSQSEEVGE